MGFFNVNRINPVELGARCSSAGEGMAVGDADTDSGADTDGGPPGPHPGSGGVTVGAEHLCPGAVDVLDPAVVVGNLLLGADVGQYC